MTEIDVREVLDYFPFPTFRKYQKEILEEIVEAFNSGYRWIFLETPTGFGKSPVNMALCRTLQSFYITPQNILLDQLQGDFPDLALIKGRKHYECLKSLISEGNCDRDAPCQKNSDYNCEDKYEKCLYWQAKINAIKSQTALTNFAYFVGEGFIPPSFAYCLGDRQLLVIDEGHNIDQHVLNFTSIVINSSRLIKSVSYGIKKTIQRLPERLSQDQINALLEEMVSLYLDHFSFRNQSFLYEEQIIDEENAEQDNEEKQARNFLRKVENYKKNLDADWVGQIKIKTYSRGFWFRVHIQPIYVKGFMNKYLWRRANRFIVSSATIFKDNFVKECGLSEHADEVCYTTVPSIFPIQNRMIIDATVGSLSWKKKVETLPAALANVSKILTIEPGKGIIHAHSYSFAEAIRNGVPNPRLMFHTSKERDKTLNDFLKAPPESGAVLVAVAMTEGLDLKGDLATFQIMFKCPYANFMGDLRVYRRLKELKHNRWYAVQTLKTLVQAYGRAVRSPTDKAAFYIIDSGINSICKQWRRQLPRFFKEAYDAKEMLI